MTEKKSTPKKKKTRATPCESCAHYDVLDESGMMGCTIDIDEDEAYRERTESRGCPYYKFYDEYKLVQKQN